ncbi:type II secretion system F family protein, partial [Microbacterium sp.]|uniref:type II secretion system F family protein n=1 Tax=Microbacterium sp. TaxID=51671 RepID=UPI003C1D5161
AAVVLLVLLGRASPAAALLPPVAGVVAAIAYDARLSQAARARVGRIQEELPTVLEFLALCLSAGEGILDSLRRVSAVGAGELTSELRGVVLAVGTGSSLSEALGRLSSRLEIAALSRSIDQLVAAIDRGAPLAHVLHSQALDAREDAKRGLIERAGRKEIYMLVPLVFLILPLSVLFAVFPGIFMLRLGIG